MIEYLDESLCQNRLTDDVAIPYDFTPANTTLVIENGVAVSMNRIYLP